MNRLHALLHRPERGWDPIRADYSLKYDDYVSQNFDANLIRLLDARLGGLAGKRVLDLGGGPGQYTVALARQGAVVTWYDVSRTYRRLAEERAKDADVEIEFGFGYFEEARRLADRPFDLVFNRVCWNYSMADRPFARLLYDLVKPGGLIFIDAANETFSGARESKPVTYWLNDKLWIKVGHPHPPRGRIAELLNRLPLLSLEVDYSAPDRDVVYAVKR